MLRKKSWIPPPTRVLSPEHPGSSVDVPVPKTELVNGLLLKTDMDQILALISLQTAAGSFRYDKSVLDLVIGPGEVQRFREICEGRNIAQDRWLTAFIIAFIEQRFASQIDTWELLVEKSREWLNDDELIEEAKKIPN